MYYRDCRTDETYNQKYLNQNDSNYVMGYDLGTSIGIDFLNRLGDELLVDDKFTDERNGFNVMDYLSNRPQILEKLKEDYNFHINLSRNALITTCLDEMPEEEYYKAKEEIDNNLREPYFEDLFEEW